MLELIQGGFFVTLAIGCASAPTVEQRLTQEYGEKLLMQLAEPSGGILLATPSGLGKAVEQPTSVNLWVNQETGSWSIVAEVEDNGSWCILRDGEGLDFSPKTEEGRRS